MKVNIYSNTKEFSLHYSSNNSDLLNSSVTRQNINNISERSGQRSPRPTLSAPNARRDTKTAFVLPPLMI